MHCTRCGNPISSHSNVCPICQYVLTEDEYKEGLEEDNKKRNPKHKAKPKKEPAPKVVAPKPTAPKVTEANASEVMLINDSSKSYTDTGTVSPIRFLGYLLFLISDAAFVYGLWYLWYAVETIYIVLGLSFAVISIILSIFAVFIVKSAGVTASFIKKNSITTAILGLLVSLAAFILLIVEMSYNNSILVFVAIGLFITGVASFIVSISAREVENYDKK